MTNTKSPKQEKISQSSENKLKEEEKRKNDSKKEQFFSEEQKKKKEKKKTMISSSTISTKKSTLKNKEIQSQKSFFVKKRKILCWIGSILFLFIGLATVSLYLFPSLNRISKPAFSLLPFPVAMVNGKIINSREVSNDLEAVKNFYLNQDFSSLNMRVDFSTPEGKDRLKIREKEILDKMIEDKIIYSLCVKYGIKISSKEAQEELEKKITESGAEKKSLELNLKILYGWSLEDFKNKVIVNQLRLKKLFEYYQEKGKSKEKGFQKILQAQKELEEGKIFSEVVKKYSEGESASKEGELGWFSYEMLIPQVAEKVFNLEKGKISNVIESPLGYHIVKVDDIRFVDSKEKENNENQKEQGNLSAENFSEKQNDNVQTIKEIKISQIFVGSGGFMEWFEKEKAQFKVLIFSREFLWDNKKGKVIFRDEKMNKKEKELRLKGEGDPSL